MLGDSEWEELYFPFAWALMEMKTGLKSPVTPFICSKTTLQMVCDMETTCMPIASAIWTSTPLFSDFDLVPKLLFLWIWTKTAFCVIFSLYSEPTCNSKGLVWAKQYQTVLGYTSQVSSVFCAIWLVPLSQNILYYSPSSKTRWRPVLFNSFLAV